MVLLWTKRGAPVIVSYHNTFTSTPTHLRNAQPWQMKWLNRDFGGVLGAERGFFPIFFPHFLISMLLFQPKQFLIQKKKRKKPPLHFLWSTFALTANNNLPHTLSGATQPSKAHSTSSLTTRHTHAHTHACTLYLAFFFKHSQRKCWDGSPNASPLA